jgi:hypothetical protein
VGEALQEAQIVVLKETPSKVLGTRGSNRPNFKLFSLFVPPKILKKLLKKALQYICAVYIIQRLVKREEAGSYRASG